MSYPKKYFIEICRKYCRYFREGVKEDEACQGLKVLTKLIDPRSIELTGGKCETLFPSCSTDTILDKFVCAKCEWRADDCDYRSVSPPPGAEPCGGLVYLALLIERGIIDEEKLAASAE